MEFTVQRSRWCRAGTNQAPRSENRFYKPFSATRDEPTSFLLTKAGNMCCLGFVCKQLGAADENMLGVGLVNDINQIGLAGTLIDTFDRPTALFDKAIPINDDKTISDAEREAKLVDLFAEYGHKLTFVD